MVARRVLAPLVGLALADVFACAHDAPGVAKPDPAASAVLAAPCSHGNVSTTVPAEYLACATDAECDEWRPCCTPLAIARRYLHCTEVVTCPAVACVYAGGARDVCVGGTCRVVMPGD